MTEEEANIQKLANNILLSVEKVQQICNTFNENDWDFKISSDKWCKKEILGHLVDSAQNNIRRLIIGQYRNNENIVYNQNIWVKAADYQHYNTADLLPLFVLLNKHFCKILLNLPVENLKTLTDWGLNEPNLVTLEFASLDYLRHLDHHINQIISK